MGGDFDKIQKNHGHLETWPGLTSKRFKSMREWNSENQARGQLDEK